VTGTKVEAESADGGEDAQAGVGAAGGHRCGHCQVGVFVAV